MLNYDPFWIAKAHLELWNNRNPKAFKELLAPTATVRFVWEKEVKPAAKTLEEHVALWQSAFIDAKFTHTDIIPAEGTLVIEWVCEATHSGKFFEIPPTGRHGKVRGASVLQINEDGKIVKETIYLNLNTVLAQFGIMPPVTDPLKLRDLALAYEEALTRHDIPAIVACLAPEAVIVRENDVVLTRDEYITLLTEFFVAVPDTRVQATHVTVRGNEVVVEELVTGTHKALLSGVEPTDRTVRFETCTILTFELGKIQKVRLYRDLYTLMANIGAVPELVLR